MNFFIHFKCCLILICLIKFSHGEKQCNEFNPCKNMADCLMRDDDSSRVRCVCKRGFNGNLCEKWPKVCSTDFCFNGGTCVLIKRIPRCLCQSEFKGLFCENLTFPTQMSEKSNSLEQLVKNNNTPLITESASKYTTIPTTTTTTMSTTASQIFQMISELPSIEYFTPPHPPISQSNIINPFIQNSFMENSVQSNMPDFNPYNTYETIQTSKVTTEQTTQPSSTTTSSFMTFEYPKNYFVNMGESSQGSANSNYLTEKATQSSSICNFDPCLNYGNCVPLTNSNSMFKFRCICPENYNGILCENSVISQNFKNKESTFDSNHFSDLYFTEPLLSMLPKKPMSTTDTSTTSTTTTTTTTTSTTPSTTTSTSTTTPLITDSISTTTSFETTPSNRAFSFFRNQKKYSICSQLRPCANNGQCMDVENYNEGMQRFRCICKSEFTGIFCHIKVNRRKVNACTYNSCLNSGECIASRDNNSFTCVCHPNFTGKFCEINSY